MTNHEQFSSLDPKYLLRRFLPSDIRGLSGINVDYLSETYSFEYYLYYLIRFPTLCKIISLKTNENVPLAYSIVAYIY
jgi:hypothetical protein